MKKAIKIIVCLLILVVLIGVLAAVIIHTNGLTTDFKAFYVNVNGSKVVSSSSGYKLDNSNPLDIQVKYLFDKLSDKTNGYSVKVVPADNITFDFTVDGEVHRFQDETDLSSGFKIDLREKDFSVTSKGCVQQVLSSVYPGAVVEVPEDMARSEDEIFKLIVFSYNDKDRVEIIFGVSSNVAVEGVTLPDGVIVL